MDSRPDVLLIVLDTLRADRLSCYGYSRPTTPNVDEFAADAVLFERAVSPAQWTIPAHASFFTGEYPTTHMTTQIYDKHSKEVPTLAEILHSAGYHTVGFCNNPLLGVIENDLDRGFEEMYNYGGAIPIRPAIGDARPSGLTRLSHRLARAMGRLTTRTEDLFARNPQLLRFALHPLIVPLWQSKVNFKGNTRQSMRDIVGYLRTRQAEQRERPLFMFVNLMETHLPFWPPPRFIRRFAEYYTRDREARAFMKGYNREHYRWMIPLSEPLTELQDRVINDLYDTEVAFEDQQLRKLFQFLQESDLRDNTLVIVTSDHGEGMNHHNFVGHSLVVYDDLISVPFMIRYPGGNGAGDRVRWPVSTRRIFHTVLDIAGVDVFNGADDGKASRPLDVKSLSLRNVRADSVPEPDHVFAEAYVPDTLITLMEAIDAGADESMRWRESRRAVYWKNYKLITVGDSPDELFDVAEDPGELVNLLDQHPHTVSRLNDSLCEFARTAESRRPARFRRTRVDLEDDEELVERLRGLGYME